MEWSKSKISIFGRKMTKSGGTYLGKKFENRENMFFTRIERIEQKFLQKKFLDHSKSLKNRGGLIS